LLRPFCFFDVVAASGQFAKAVNRACLPDMPLHMHWQFSYKAAELGDVDSFVKLQMANEFVVLNTFTKSCRGFRQALRVKY
jgi:hypothetical protein